MIYDIAPVNNYTGNNNTTNFEFNFYIDNEDQLKVTLFDKNNIQHTLQNEIDYSINEIKNQNGSYITFPLSSSNYSILADNEKISLELTLPISQETQYNNSSLLNLEALEYSFDYLTRLIQILSRKQELSLKVSEFSDKTPEELYNQLNSSASSVAETSLDINQKYNELKNIYENINSNYEKFEQIETNTTSIETINDTLNDKLEEDLSNISAATKNEICSWAYPSEEYIELSIGASDKTYTAPTDGYVQLKTTVNGGGLFLSTDEISIGNGSLDIGAGIQYFIPVFKNQIFRLGYTSINLSSSSLKFYPAKGATND